MKNECVGLCIVLAFSRWASGGSIQRDKTTKLASARSRDRSTAWRGSYANRNIPPGFRKKQNVLFTKCSVKMKLFRKAVIA
ncbi:hypothetical protein TNCT_167031 [Trichonephila clavata]|uniref:Secreted protein n=1 Tax=Trichonephila clavata TaxID=2740835 RepID=A0A8X6JMF4_TRICU|nr:hypothetical protein TNCT_167031 [Trichonephila clavata]